MSHPLEERAREIHALFNEEGCGFYDAGSGPGDKCLDCENIVEVLAQLQAEARLAKLNFRLHEDSVEIACCLFNKQFAEWRYD